MQLRNELCAETVASAAEPTAAGGMTTGEYVSHETGMVVSEYTDRIRTSRAFCGQVEIKAYACLRGGRRAEARRLIRDSPAIIRRDTQSSRRARLQKRVPVDRVVLDDTSSEVDGFN